MYESKELVLVLLPRPQPPRLHHHYDTITYAQIESACVIPQVNGGSVYAVLRGEVCGADVINKCIS